MDTVSEMAAVTAQQGRSAGTDAERRTAGLLRDRLRKMGREAELQTVQVRPRYGLVHSAHALLAVVGSVVAVDNPAVGGALILAAALSTLLDVTNVLHFARRLTGRRVSQNVESIEGGDKPGTLVLVAHYDAAREARAFLLAERVLRDPWRAILGAMLVLIACSGARALGAEGVALTAAQFVPTVLLILLVPALADIELSETSRGTADNAAGVATVLRLADELGGRLEHFDLWVVFTGAQEPFALGMSGWLRERRKGLDRERTAVLNVDGVGRRPITFSRREGPVFALRSHSQLVRICREIAEDEAIDGAPSAHPRVNHRRSDAAAAIARGLPALTVSREGDTIGPEEMDGAYAFCRELIERLDAEVGPDLAEAEAGGEDQDQVRTSAAGSTA